MARTTNKSRARVPAAASSIATMTFPPLQPKQNVNCRVLLDNQILLIDNILSSKECEAYVQFIESLPLELTPRKKRGEAERNNYRISVTSVEFAHVLLSLLSPHVPPLPYPASARRPDGPNARPFQSVNSNIRLYKYTPGQYFGPHYDDSVRDPLSGEVSEWTLLIYLSGVEDGVQGGETVFYRDQRGQPREIITAPLTRGTALLHRHGHECLLHEGTEVMKGVKYILRSDLMFA